jgi:uncharacterized protein
MAAGLPDLVDCVRLASEAATLHRVYEMGELPRVQDLLVEVRGTLSASFVFTKLASGHSGATIVIAAIPRLECQRCLQGFDLSVSGGSEVEFRGTDEPDAAPSEREFYRMKHGQVSLRELAEEELLLALPLAPKCATPATCGRAPGSTSGETSPGVAGETGETGETGVIGDMRQPFRALKDLLKKT